MKTFNYQAQSQSGAVINGVLQAPTKEEAQKALQSAKLKPLLVSEKSSVFDRIAFFNKVSLKDKAMFARQLATMIGSGLPLLQAIRIVEQQIENERFKVALQEMVRDLEGGYSFSVALSKHEKIFDKIFISLVAAGEASGQLETVLNELAERLENDTNFQAKVKGALAYPALILVVMVIMGIYVVVKIIPELMPLFEDTKTPLPISTKILIFMSNSLIKFWYLYITGVVGLFAGLRIFLASDSGQEWFSEGQLKVPLIGPLLKGAYMASLLSTFSLLIRSGIPIIETIKLTAEAVGNRVYKKVLLSAIPKVEKGVPFSTPLSQSPNIPIIVGQMILVGEQTGKLDSVLKTLARFYAQETETKIKSFSSLIEPVIIVIMGLGVAFLVLSVIGPIYTATQNMANSGP